MEKDDFMTKHMVLLVGDIKHNTKINQYVIELLDGWKSVYAEIKQDNYHLQPIYNLIQQKKLYSGLKIHVVGMQIKQDNKKLDKDSNSKSSGPVYVDINYNSISRAKWNQKLGICSQQYLIKNLKSIHCNGGFISMIDVFVIKKYPLVDRQIQGAK